MDQVSNLVYNALAKRQGVVLPGIGTLYAVTVPAEMQKPGVVTPPVNQVELVTDELPGDSAHRGSDRWVRPDRSRTGAGDL